MDSFALLVRGAHHGQRGAIVHGCESASVAVREDVKAIFNHAGSVCAHPPVNLHVLIGEFLRFADQFLDDSLHSGLG